MFFSRKKQFILNPKKFLAVLVLGILLLSCLKHTEPAFAATLTYKGVDVMKWTKDTLRNQPTDQEIDGIVAAIADTIKPTHIPLDSTADYGSNPPSPRSAENFTKKWVDTIHARGIKVVWRGTWSGIEGIYDFRKLHGESQIPAGSLSSAPTDGNKTWLGKTYNYIVQHPDFFSDGDIWAPLPERTEGIFWDSSSFITHDGAGIRENYEDFFKELKAVSDLAFDKINKNAITGLTAQNYSEVASGWLSTGFLDEVGIVTVDHYGITHLPEEMESDIRKINKMQGMPVFLQEWGDYWHPHLSQSERTEYLKGMYDVFQRLVEEGILIGFNYWGAWGGSQEGILDKVDGVFKINYRGAMLADFFQNLPSPSLPAPPPSPTPTPQPTPPPPPANQITLPQNWRDGDVVKFTNFQTVYLVKPDGLHPFDSLPSFETLPGSSSSYTTKSSLAREVLGQTNLFYPTGSLINDSGTIYMIRSGQKIAFTNLEAFLGLGYSLQNVFADSLSAYLMSTFQISSALQEHPWGSWVIDNQTVYYSHQNGLIGVPRWQTFLDNGGMPQNILPANEADLKILQANSDLPLLVSNDPRVSR